MPKQLESGTTKRIGRITRRGQPASWDDVVVPWMVYRYSDWAKSFVTRIGRGTKLRKKIAIVALAKKLLVILWAMLRTNTPWRPLVPTMAESSGEVTDLPGERRAQRSAKGKRTSINRLRIEAQHSE